MKLLKVVLRINGSAKAITVQLGSDFSIRIQGERGKRIVFSYDTRNECWCLCPTVDMTGDVHFDKPNARCVDIPDFMRQHPGRHIPLDDSVVGQVHIADDKVKISFLFQEPVTIEG
ncbi:MAG: hypothetical protein PHS79_06020 [Patescibacteria group bacterium]|nr:hypothetical protein [Patescibacteria group bacterium]